MRLSKICQSEKRHGANLVYCFSGAVLSKVGMAIQLVKLCNPVKSAI